MAQDVPMEPSIAKPEAPRHCHATNGVLAGVNGGRKAWMAAFLLSL